MSCDGSSSPTRSPPMQGDDSTTRTINLGGNGDREIGLGSNGGQERVVRETMGSVVYPTLTRTNYSDWALVMRVNLQAQGLWEAIEPGNADYHDDRLALSAILRAVSLDMLSTLVVKDTAKQAWDAVKTIRMGVERVREANAQKLRKEFEDIEFMDGDSVDDFSMRITGLVNNLLILGDTLEEEKPRYVVNRVTAGDYDCPRKVLSFLTDLHASFRMLNLRNDFLRKKFDGMKYDLRRVEEVYYDVKIRGLVSGESKQEAAQS